ncbi:hypothetical protein N790_02885 [Arenimonas malthae CC-JY-1]|uniref:DnrO protein n=1 Tax=Arenimonas malthae CC-JY-1 TaxID=1384054 RepID=A0A091ASU3_9GAMM|nr:hypothetical protein [Arenimonas malthae]KFN42232.1 hypothetical protein N790_02885 [Arenimonas malthae CC-JY-1]
MSRLSFAICLALLLPLPALAGEHAHAADPHAHAAAAPSGDAAAPAARWQPDAPLSRGMQRVRAATAALEHGEHGHLEAAQVQGIAAELRAAVDEMFANCRLDPEPDAALHPLLARVLTASRALAGGEFDQAALDELRAVLARYPQLFEDAAWMPL